MSVFFFFFGGGVVLKMPSLITVFGWNKYTFSLATLTISIFFINCVIVLFIYLLVELKIF